MNNYQNALSFFIHFCQQSECIQHYFNGISKAYKTDYISVPQQPVYDILKYTKYKFKFGIVTDTTCIKAYYFVICENDEQKAIL